MRALKYPLLEKRFMKKEVYIGVDGCREGWVAAVLDHGELVIDSYKDFNSLIECYPAFDTFLVDMPIGLKNNNGQKRPEKEARQVLGKRSSTVFPVPCRKAVYSETEEEQKRANISILEKSLSRQSIAIIPKIKELDVFFKDHPEYKNTILESHPELCFTRLKGSLILSKKKELSGALERMDILSDYLSNVSLQTLLDKAKEIQCNLDDLIDALCLAVTAALKAHGLTETIPLKPEKDDCGLYMMMTVPKRI
ncbi:MAG: DUF429 domain-containing protein [Oscillospiraceae bacterium]|nr:DUF429 domain-containing protein [Oscillospiraceae bacterium]